MLDTRIVCWIAGRVPGVVPGTLLHRAALRAMHAGAYPLADALFERAADRYRLDLEVERLARLRVHQSMARALATGDPTRDPAACLEIEQRLARLQSIESLEPPFDVLPASRLLATWIAGTHRAEPAAGVAVPEHAAA
ncbi:MAG: hypothetical protein HY076_03040 [Candidatus Eisenbacteria bacterium]|uniref:Uncharacterized protein n=1 Tax=Eiseniibacteriota bacterium TaxID=2212470 RepID=A0A9D6L943_UNCEI|nr:hypothetical protein [Candidatus Eisenbacteria bacterium]MBI3539230.1 hypothetical protein [Candidatus Eisenbacteria bacterium]